jgi:DNA primase
MHSRDLLDLGHNPANYIVYPGGNSFFIDEVVEDTLCSFGLKPVAGEIDDLFWPYLMPDIRRVLEPFRQRELRARKTASVDQETELSSRCHMFDKRRIHYLKFGQINQSGIGRASPKLFRVLHNKSRDEIEQGFIEQETVLNVNEYKTYIYAIFNLQNFFSEYFAKTTPQALDQSRLDEYFLAELCRLNDDHVFWAGMPHRDKLHEYLVRYAVMFFDYDYKASHILDEYILNFINSRRRRRSPSKKRVVSMDESSTIFGETKAFLAKMSRGDLARLYRRKAQKLHPDKGGDHDKFVMLTEAYHDLLGRKP